MNALDQLLFDIGNIAIVIHTVIFLIYLKFYNRENTSFLITFGVLICSALFMQAIEIKVFEISESYTVLARYLWYSSFAAIDLFSIYCVYKLHVITRASLSSLAVFISCSYLFLTIAQVSRLFDRLIIETDLLGSIYSYSVIATNALITIAAIVTVIYSITKSIVLKKRSFT